MADAVRTRRRSRCARCDAALCSAVLASAVLAAWPSPAAERGESANAGGMWTRETLSGDWGGWRGTLAEHGIAIDLTATSDVVGIVSGGLHRDAELLSAWHLGVTLDGEPLLGWRGGRLFVDGLALSNTGSPSESAGDIQALDNIDAPSQWRLYEAWLEQALLGDRLSLRAGIYDVGTEFDVLEAASLFVNSSFGTGRDLSQSGENGPGIFPATALGVRVEAKPLANAYARVALIDGVPGNPNSRMGPAFISLGSDEGLLCIAEAGYLGGAEEGEAPSTKVGLGGWLYSAQFDRIDGLDAGEGAVRRARNGGLYLLGEHVVYRQPHAPRRALAAFGRVGFANADVSPVGVYAGGGFVYTGLLRGRPDDQLGLGVAAAFAGHAFEKASQAAGDSVNGAEVAIELTYRTQLTPWLSLQPDLQYIVSPGFDADVGDALVVGARVEVAY